MDECPKCGEEMFTVEGLHNDRDGVRNDRWCENCLTMFSSHAHAFRERLVLKDRFAGKAKNRIAGLLRAALEELE